MPHHYRRVFALALLALTATLAHAQFEASFGVGAGIYKLDATVGERTLMESATKLGLNTTLTLGYRFTERWAVRGVGMLTNQSALYSGSRVGQQDYRTITTSSTYLTPALELAYYPCERLSLGLGGGYAVELSTSVRTGSLYYQPETLIPIPQSYPLAHANVEYYFGPLTARLAYQQGLGNAHDQSISYTDDVGNPIGTETGTWRGASLSVLYRLRAGSRRYGPSNSLDSALTALIAPIRRAAPHLALGFELSANLQTTRVGTDGLGRDYLGRRTFMPTFGYALSDAWRLRGALGYARTSVTARSSAGDSTAAFVRTTGRTQEVALRIGAERKFTPRISLALEVGPSITVAKDRSAASYGQNELRPLGPTAPRATTMWYARLSPRYQLGRGVYALAAVTYGLNNLYGSAADERLADP